MQLRYLKPKNYYEGTQNDRLTNFGSVSIANNGLEFYETDTSVLYRVLNGVWISVFDSGSSHHPVSLSSDASLVLSLSDQEIGLVQQSANSIFSGPTSGSPAVPTFRSLVADDITPVADGVYLRLDAANDPVTGAIVFQNAADSVTAFQILDADGGTPVFNVDTTNERVGIGTGTPGYPLHVTTSASTAYIVSANTSNIRTFYGSSDGYGGGLLGTISNNPFYLIAFGTTVATFRQSGRLGIGQIAPLAKLHIKGTTDEIQQIIQANATQTANLAEWQNSGGAVLVNITGAGNLQTQNGRIKNTTRVTTTYTILVSDEIVFANTDAGAYTATLPAGVEGQTIKVINSGSSGNILTVAPNGAEDLMGVNSNFSLNDAESLILTYNATDGWY